MKRQWYYRGSLKSCNYSCSYCPFSKKKDSLTKLQMDRTAFFRFVEKACKEKIIQGAVQIVPYGEALIHSYYWEGLAKLSRNPQLDAVGAQSNFSFPVEQMLSYYREQGGIADKLRLWGTFHPEMTSIEQFVQQCKHLTYQKISYCVGAVGVPEHIPIIQKLRHSLPSSVYLWINKMDGADRIYTPSEKKAFLEIDSYFELELSHHKSDWKLCMNNRFVEADGTMHRCNLDKQSVGNFYHDIVSNKIPACRRKECSCFLSYCNQKEEALRPFLPYPAFRIPLDWNYSGTSSQRPRSKLWGL